MAATTLLPPGRAGQLVAELGDCARLCDLYGPHGAPIYHDMSLRDTGEVRHLVGLVRPHPGPVLDLAAGSGRGLPAPQKCGRQMSRSLRTVCASTARSMAAKSMPFRNSFANHFRRTPAVGQYGSAR